MLAFHVSRRRSRKEFNALFDKLKGLNIKRLHTDNCNVYKKIQKKYKPTYTKDQTTQVESFNSILRDEISRLRRKTKAYSKSMIMIFKELRIFLEFYNRKLRKNFEKLKFMVTFAKERMVDRRVMGFTSFN